MTPSRRIKRKKRSKRSRNIRGGGRFFSNSLSSLVQDRLICNWYCNSIDAKIITEISKDTSSTEYPYFNFDLLIKDSDPNNGRKPNKTLNNMLKKFQETLNTNEVKKEAEENKQKEEEEAENKQKEAENKQKEEKENKQKEKEIQYCEDAKEQVKSANELNTYTDYCSKQESYSKYLGKYIRSFVEEVYQKNDPDRRTTTKKNFSKFNTMDIPDDQLTYVFYKKQEPAPDNDLLLEAQKMWKQTLAEKAQTPQQELDLTEIPSQCKSFRTLYNEYTAIKKRLRYLITENKPTRLVQIVLDGTVTRLAGLRAVSLRGGGGDIGCESFESWYTKNKSWFTREFEEIKQLIKEYNQSQNYTEKLVLPFDGSKPFNFSGGKFRRTKRNQSKRRK